MGLRCLIIRHSCKALTVLFAFLLCHWESKGQPENNHTNEQEVPQTKLAQSELQNTLPKSINKIPAALISLGNHPTAYALIVEKLQHKLSVYRANAPGEYELVKTYQAVTGKKQGDKKSTGDKRTPEGIYFITGRINGNKLPPKYGPGALTLDYPNIYDQRLSKTGYGIWIHGVEDDTRIDKPFDTDGCVALKNQDWQDLIKYISPLETPVIITKKMALVESKEILEEQKNEIMSMLEDWKKAWENSDLNSYVSFYSDSFRSLGKSKKQWLAMKANLSSTRKGGISVEINNPKILSFENQILVSFFQKYSSPDKEDFGRKFLYLQKENNEYKIISEKWLEEKNSSSINAIVRQTNDEYISK